MRGSFFPTIMRDLEPIDGEKMDCWESVTGKVGCVFRLHSGIPVIRFSRKGFLDFRDQNEIMERMSRSAITTSTRPQPIPT
jgi:hypothetical protein